MVAARWTAYDGVTILYDVHLPIGAILKRNYKSKAYNKYDNSKADIKKSIYIYKGGYMCLRNIKQNGFVCCSVWRVARLSGLKSYTSVVALPQAVGNLELSYYIKTLETQFGPLAALPHTVISVWSENLLSWEETQQHGLQLLSYITNYIGLYIFGYIYFFK